MTLSDFVHRLQRVNTLSKHEQLVNGIIDAIDSQFLKVGEQLPSINVMVDEVGYARKTIVKAYEDLKERGLVESKKNKGYFIVSKDTNQLLRVALLLYSFQRFQEEFYNTLREELGESAQIDVFFHHNNLEVFDTIFSNIYGKYGLYVIAPIEDGRVSKLLKTLSPEKLIVVDRFLDIGPEYTYVTQEFENTTFQLLIDLKSRIEAFDKAILFFRNDLDYPEGVHSAFLKFVGESGINSEVRDKYEEGSMHQGELYIFISDSDMWNLLKDSRNNELLIGQDIGVLSFNDHVFKELVFGGITTISTDFTDMARATAREIRSNELGERVVIPTHLQKRHSL